VYPGAPPPPPQDVAQLAHGMSQLAHGMSQLSHGPSYLHAQASVIHTGTDGRGSVLQLEMSADGLKGKDMMSKSDPCCVVEIWENEKWQVVGKTETLKNTHKPHWSTRVKVAYVFEQLQTMRFRVMDVDTGMLRSDDVLGFVCAPLADVIRAGGIAFPLEKHPKKKIAGGSGKGLGTLVVRAHEEGGAVGGLTRVKLKLSASKLDRADGPFSKSDPYFLVEQTVNNGHAARSILCRSEVVMNSLNPTWQPVTFMVNSNGRPPHEVELEIRLMDHDDRSKHDLLGVVRCSLAALIPGAILDVINAAKQKKKGAKYSNSGRVYVDFAIVQPFPSYVSYTMGGCRLRFMCAVDYTASNGSPRTPGTLHYTDGVTLSPYGQALEAVGSVITPYLPDDRTLEAFGFGAILAGSSVSSFDFPLQLAAGPMGDPRVVGLEGLMEAYKSSVYNVKFHGSTNFSPILSRAMSASMSPAAPSQQHQHYTIALILTDGQCTDMQETINRIVEASHAHPLSIVIVGVGDADFSAMKRLDGDSKRLSGSSGKASRDIVQFVQWKQGMSPIQLASEVLAEIPQSLVEYMVDRGVVPNPPVPVYY
jgi:Copine/C2 domain